ncbi:MAG: hypothetical protein LBU02_00685 [Rickettsiales bacterium]|jgi:hypothetical protein|nr:hypothetical protein [Rickettsiales bacterium]
MTDNLTYEKIKEIVANNPNITVKEFYEQLRQKGTDREIFDLLEDAISSERHDVSEDYAVFLKIVELFAQLDLQVKQSSGGRTMLNIAVTNKQADVVKILLESGKFNEEKKLHALNSAIVQGNVQEFEVFLDYLNHESILEALNTSHRNESTEIMKVLLDNKKLTGVEKVDALSNAFIDGGLPKVRLLLEHMTGIPEDGIRNLLEIIEERKLSLKKELKIDSEFKVDFDNSNHYEYLSNRVIIALLGSAINNTPDVEENGARSSSSGGNSVSTGQTSTLDGNFVRRLYNSIAWDLSSESLQLKLSKQKISLQSKCDQGVVLGNALLEHAIEHNQNHSKVIKLLLEPVHDLKKGIN